jgi:dipeptidyl aminopeptidase/acylaminoacyl peptidase
VAADGRFSLPVKIEGPLWSIPGNYSLIVQYGFKHVSATVQFQFEEEDIPTAGVFNVKDLSSGQNFDLNYTITGGKVSSIVIDPQDIALVIHLDTQNSGMVHLQIPRLLLDAKKPGNSDESFLVFVNDDEITSFSEENSDSNYRILDIPIMNGDYKIEIIGTTIVLEFESVSRLMRHWQ